MMRSISDCLHNILVGFWPACAAVALVIVGLFNGAAGGTAADTPANQPTNPVGFYATRYEKTPTATAMTAMGRTLFFDTALSASGRMSCASCHDPAHAMSPANSLSVQLGGPQLQDAGNRAVPSLKYLQTSPAFTEHYFGSEGNDSEDQGPTGGFTWDGRFNQPHEQAIAPLLSPVEMANANSHDVIAKLRHSPSAAQFRQTYGDHVLDVGNEPLAWNGLLLALEVFQQSPADFYPYTSKYDAWLRHQVALSEREQRGLTLFNDPDKGNCAQCHVSAIQSGAFPQFTDYGLIALGVPRNAAIPSNSDSTYFDLGLCGPLRTDLQSSTDYCGRFKTPTLRNVALKKSFFHNGVMHSLEDVIRFYSERDVHPEKFYPVRADGRVDKFNDIPIAYQDNLDVTAPFDQPNRRQPLFTDAEIADLLAFLNTLTDGYTSP
jgi:cytochrome c peroxidase